MTFPWLTIIGIGEDGLDGLNPTARALIAGAEVLVGGARHLAMVPDAKAERLMWSTPFADSRDQIEARRGKKVVVLASGDPMWFGAAATLTRWFAPSEMTVIAHPGAFSLAAARLLWPLQDCLCLTAHGRPLDALALHFAPKRRLLILSEDRNTPARLAELLADQGYGASSLTVLENLGGPTERVAPGAMASSDLNLVAVDCAVTPGRRPLPPGPGLPDDAFSHDGQLTKREVRAVTLAALAPLPGELLWDVGAGCGSIAIEWMRLGGRALAVEPRAERAERIARNAAALGVPALDIITARAPAGLPLGREVPDAIFVGGGVSEPGLLDICRAALAPGGRLVANAVTVEGEAALIAFHAAHGGEMTRLSVARLAPVGGFHTWHSAMPVTQYVGWKR
ncbi:cobalamin biosynthesis bifunctional protein CbiET [Paramagnetospirillum kuznetsovii]|uniref:Cobalamin biosynthesis bifunctional protein CbiET n=1 Tax=Paramagnetospirillum kuznetsovii TaxID=2053833 RepID=A0A364P1D5_9PROT|nr:precorrin-6y C5,15-methyltransferase (decarboxylating) subunit CbiE [Paramagnetospirillum kuznetsovii]RAU23159.1 cobalamin biosynthesis bifunctional protein CbiET [Paramagnetospirillum kuznetsovii]